MPSLTLPSPSHQFPAYPSSQPPSNFTDIDNLLEEALQQRSECLVRKKVAEERMDGGTAKLYAHQKLHHVYQKQYQAYQHEFILATDSLDEVERKILALTQLRDGHSPAIPPTKTSPLDESHNPSPSSSRHSSLHSSDSSASHISIMSAW